MRSLRFPFDKLRVATREDTPILSLRSFEKADAICLILTPFLEIASFLSRRQIEKTREDNYELSLRGLSQT